MMIQSNVCGRFMYIEMSQKIQSNRRRRELAQYVRNG